ncbi:MAG: hypothetical protein KJ706_05735 [Candidatus Omnitrophica bacterium]|nr:hypothetical protein [Candidatus Omnitrophota bacterium]
MVRQIIDFFAARKEPGGEAVRWMLVTLAVSLMPLWGSIIIFLLLKQSFDWGTFTNKAEFAIYAASYLGSSSYIITKNFKRKNFPLRPWFSISILVTLITVVICFAVVYVNNCNTSPSPLNLIFLRNITLVAFAISLLLAFMTFVEDLVLINFNFQAVEGEQFRKLNDDFDNLQGGK